MAGPSGRRAITNLAAVPLLLLAIGATAWAQGPPVHYRYNTTTWPPGSVGQAQLQRGGPVAGYFQPVELRAASQLDVWLAEDGTFQPPQPVPVNVGLLVGQVYRFKVSGIPLKPGVEVYPTLEVLDRLYPPTGAEARHPIPVELSREDLDLALAGKLVTRVIYLEDPDRALGVAEDETTRQRYFEVGSDQDPLQVADQFGRPVAILRIGSRVPDAVGPSAAFLYGCPPLVRLPEDLPAPPTSEVLPAPPRQPLPGAAAVAPPSAEVSLREQFPFQRSRQ